VTVVVSPGDSWGDDIAMIAAAASFTKFCGTFLVVYPTRDFGDIDGSVMRVPHAAGTAARRTTIGAS
jgi:hypothetical protein